MATKPKNLLADGLDKEGPAETNESKSDFPMALKSALYGLCFQALSQERDQQGVLGRLRSQKDRGRT
jgi:hypothetical protein